MTTTFRSIHPYNQAVLAEYPVMDTKMLEYHLNSASEAFLGWKETTFTQRSEFLKRVSKRLRSNIDEYARLITMEMGKVLKEALAEVEKCAMTCDYYADWWHQKIRL